VSPVSEPEGGLVEALERDVVRGDIAMAGGLEDGEEKDGVLCQRLLEHVVEVMRRDPCTTLRVKAAEVVSEWAAIMSVEKLRSVLERVDVIVPSLLFCHVPHREGRLIVPLHLVASAQLAQPATVDALPASAWATVAAMARPGFAVSPGSDGAHLVHAKAIGVGAMAEAMVQMREGGAAADPSLLSRMITSAKSIPNTTTITTTTTTDTPHLDLLHTAAAARVTELTAASEENGGVGEEGETETETEVADEVVAARQTQVVAMRQLHRLQRATRQRLFEATRLEWDEAMAQLEAAKRTAALRQVERETELLRQREKLAEAAHAAEIAEMSKARDMADGQDVRRVDAPGRRITKGAMEDGDRKPAARRGGRGGGPKVGGRGAESARQ